MGTCGNIHVIDDGRSGEAGSPYLITKVYFQMNPLFI